VCEVVEQEKVKYYVGSAPGEIQNKYIFKESSVGVNYYQIQNDNNKKAVGELLKFLQDINTRSSLNPEIIFHCRVPNERNSFFETVCVHPLSQL
jgi:hypothetical protein